MLAVDVSFLAVPSVQVQPAAILVAYLSTFCAMGSLVVSLVLAGQVNDTRRGNAKDVVSIISLSVAYYLSPPGLIHVRNVAVYARPREPRPHAQSTICSSDMGVCSMLNNEAVAQFLFPSL